MWRAALRETNVITRSIQRAVSSGTRLDSVKFSQVLEKSQLSSPASSSSFRAFSSFSSSPRSQRNAFQQLPSFFHQSLIRRDVSSPRFDFSGNCAPAVFSARSFYTGPNQISPWRLIGRMLMQGITSFIVANPMRALKIAAIVLVGGYIVTKLMSIIFSLLLLVIFAAVAFFVGRYYWFRLFAKRAMERASAARMGAEPPPFDFSNFGKNFAAGSPFAEAVKSAAASAATAASSAASQAASSAAGAAASSSPFFKSLADMAQNFTSRGEEYKKAEADRNIVLERVQSEVIKNSSFRRIFGSDAGLLEISSELEPKGNGAFHAEVTFQVIGSRGSGGVEVIIDFQQETPKHTAEKVTVKLLPPSGGQPIDIDMSRDFVDL